MITSFAQSKSRRFIAFPFQWHSSLCFLFVRLTFVRESPPRHQLAQRVSCGQYQNKQTERGTFVFRGERERDRRWWRNWSVQTCALEITLLLHRWKWFDESINTSCRIRSNRRATRSVEKRQIDLGDYCRLLSPENHDEVMLNQR